MKLPKYLMTVTPFSKYLALSLFVILPFVGFYLGMQYQKSITSYPESTQTPKEAEIKSNYHDKKLGIQFEYQKELGSIRQFSSEESIQGEEYYGLIFDQAKSTFQISASTANFSPVAGEGSPNWLNTRVSQDESPASVKLKLEQARFKVINVESITSNNNIAAFKAYILWCYGPCHLERIYIIPMTNSKYVNLFIRAGFEKLYATPTTNEPFPIKQTEKLGKEDSINIEKGNMDAQTKNIIDIQDMIFNSLVFDKK